MKFIYDKIESEYSEVTFRNKLDMAGKVRA